MRDKTAEKMPNFFNNHSSFSQKAGKEPLIFKGSELPDLLNAPLDRDKKYHLLISFIREHNAEYLNQKITVNSHITDEKEGHTLPIGQLLRQKEYMAIQALQLKMSH